MAFTDGFEPTIAARLDASAATASFGKQNVPPLRAAREGHSMRRLVGVNRREPALAGLPAMRNQRNPEHSGAVEKPHCNA
ncbi:hypothetical protein [Bradyrhizobium uaiense]|uniref:Uncharacterized protein n=1 Tax=Bradyrhizobium uaiense TaxID=2594946 RepID=A0A6P1BDL6_9BRAD|nr:hypothetical protein [Bradyrhizobium uaiense]NEU96379.1 hypothetical protein [Bradyrhizobium uaiense]